MKKTIQNLSLVVVGVMVIGGSVAFAQAPVEDVQLGFKNSEKFQEMQDNLKNTDPERYALMQEHMENGDFKKGGFNKGKFKQLDPAKLAELEKTRDAIKNAIETGNYELFVSLHDGMENEMNITQKQFVLLKEIFKAKENGDFVKAKELRDNAGIEAPGRGMERGHFNDDFTGNGVGFHKGKLQKPRFK